MSGAIIAAGFGVWTFLRERGAGPAASAPLSALGGAPAGTADSGTGGTPPRDRGRDPAPESNVGGSAPLIVPAQGGASPFDSLRGPLDGSGGAARPRDDGARPRPASSAPVSPPSGAAGRASTEPTKTVQCYTDPFTGVVRLAVKGRIPAGAAMFACKQNPFTGQYQKAR